MPETSLYLSEAESLRRNRGQWEAYESQGNCVVLAGPGSGKTRTLTLKLARMLAEDVEAPRGVACITYNNECVRELEDRLEQLGIQAGPRLFIGTVHSFSLTQIVLPYSRTADMGLPDGFAVATRAERALALRRAYRKTIGGPEDPQLFDFSMGTYRRSILNRDTSEWRERDPRLAALAEGYEAELRSMARIDFDDMPLLAVRALQRHGWLQRALLAKYPILMVDEYQDLGRALHRMVMGLCFSVGMRLFAVGDADQSIYGFSGAHPRLLRQVAERADVKAVRLRLNYRCGSRIVAASSYALGEPRDYEAAAGAHEGTIYFHGGSGGYDRQARHVFATILPSILARNAGLSIGDVAILYPAAWIGDALAEAAQAQGVAFVRSDTNSVYPRHSRLMRWLETCAAWCCGGWRTGSPGFERILREGERIFAEAVANSDARMGFRRRLVARLWQGRDEAELMGSWLTTTISAVLEGFVACCPSVRDEGEILTAFVQRCIVGDCREMTLGHFAGQGEGRDCIKLSTLHSAKGREFWAVVMFGLDEGRLPRTNSTAAQLVEARRLFYVGFTRAKMELHLMYSSGRASRFVSETHSRLS